MGRFCARKSTGFITSQKTARRMTSKWLVLGQRCGPEGLERAPADAHDAGPLAFEMSAPGAGLGSAKCMLKALKDNPLMLMMLALGF